MYLEHTYGGQGAGRNILKSRKPLEDTLIRLLTAYCEGKLSSSIEIRCLSSISRSRTGGQIAPGGYRVTRSQMVDLGLTSRAGLTGCVGNGYVCYEEFDNVQEGDCILCGNCLWNPTSRRCEKSTQNFRYPLTLLHVDETAKSFLTSPRKIKFFHKDLWKTPQEPCVFTGKVWIDPVAAGLPYPDDNERPLGLPCGHQMCAICACWLWSLFATDTSHIAIHLAEIARDDFLKNGFPLPSPTTQSSQFETNRPVIGTAKAMVEKVLVGVGEILPRDDCWHPDWRYMDPLGVSTNFSQKTGAVHQADVLTGEMDPDLGVPTKSYLSCIGRPMGLHRGRENIRLFFSTWSETNKTQKQLNKEHAVIALGYLNGLRQKEGALNGFPCLCEGCDIWHPPARLIRMRNTPDMVGNRRRNMHQFHSIQ